MVHVLLMTDKSHRLGDNAQFQSMSVAVITIALILFFHVYVTAVGLAQLLECWRVEQEVVGLIPGHTNTQGLKITFAMISAWLDFHVAGMTM